MIPHEILKKIRQIEIRTNHIEKLAWMNPLPAAKSSN